MSEHSPPDRLPGERDGAAQLERAIRRARLALLWEDIWPSLASLATVTLLFAAVSWAGVWTILPALGRIAGLCIFAILIAFTLLPLRRLQWPTSAAARARLDRQTGRVHRPVTAMTDRLATTGADPLTAALWQTHQRRAQESVGRVRAGLPHSRLALADPWALRALVLAFAIAAFFAAGSERMRRMAAAFDFSGVVAVSTARLDAWVSPPAYTARAPILLTGQQAGPADDFYTVPVGSRLVIRASAPEIEVTAEGAIEADAAPAESNPPPAGVAERRFIIRGDAAISVTSPRHAAPWRFTAIPDLPPMIELAKDPEPQARGSLLLAYVLEDDYGVAAARATFQRATKGNANASQAPRALYAPPEIPLVLPAGRGRQGQAQTIKDLTEHPYAGAEVDMVLIARDEAGNEGRSTARRMTLPQRPFTEPLARALIELRRLIALDADQRPLVAAALDALLVAPAAFTPKAGTYLGLRTVANALERAGTDDELREVVAQMWALAIAIEDGDLTDAEKDLRAAQEALKQALERGASEEEIRKLMENLRAAVDKYIKQMIEQALRNPQQQNPLDRNARTMSDQDLRNMLDRLDRLSRSGDRDGARQLLEQLQALLDNLRMARPGQNGEGDPRSMMNELADILRKQQRLRDRTYQQGRDPRGQRDELGGLQQDQQALRQRLQQLLEQLRRQGLAPQPGQQGQQGQQGQGEQGHDGQGGQELGQAGDAMGDAQGQLGEGNSSGAVDSQGRAIESLRRGAQGLAQALQQGQQGQGDNGEPGSGNGRGRQSADSPQTDPLGRPYRGRDYGNDTTVKVPGEIDVQRARRILDELRRRFSDPGRPQLELDYLERLLKDY